MRRLLLTILLIIVSSRVDAQYFTSGSSDFRTKWNQIEGDSVRVIYPGYYLPKAVMIDRYIDTMRSAITCGLSIKATKIPVILYPEKAKSNGLVVWTPKRLEMYTIPSSESFSLPWLKQLSVHEYRHVVQISNLNRGLVKIGGYLLGEQMIGAATALVPTWFYEGDATLAETQLAIWGRGKQPRFSAPVRAMINEMPKRWSYKKWKVGSLRYGYPSIYELGYFGTWAGQTFYSPTIWDEMFDYAARRPVRSIFDFYNIKHKYGVGCTGVINRTVMELDKFWNDSFLEENSAQKIKKEYQYYQEFSSPMMLNDTTILSLRQNKSSVESFVLTNINSGESNILDNSVYTNSRPILVGNAIYWSEYKPSLFWENNSTSVIKKADIKISKSGYKLAKPEIFKSENNNPHFITNIDSNHFAYINYDSLNNPHIIIANDKMQTLRCREVGGWDSSIAGMDYDNLTNRLYISMTDNRGVVLVGVDIDNLKFNEIKSPSHVTITNLRAGDGKLYYSSTLSGKDEIHVLDLTTNREYQISHSQYGTYSPTLPFKNRGDTTVVVTTYEFGGYRLATQKLDSLKEVETALFPSSRLVPDWYDWNMPKIDTINIVPDSTITNQIAERRYRRFSNTINLHSWMPLLVDPIEQLNEFNINEIGVGATVVSQNLLGGVTASLGYGYMPNSKMGMLMAGLSFTSLPVHFDVHFDYGGYEQGYYTFSENPSVSTLNKHQGVSATASLPINLSSGRRSRLFTPFVGYSYDNSIIERNDNSHIKGLNKLSYGLAYRNSKYMAEQDLESPLSYYIKVSGLINPVTKNFGKLYSLYGEGTLPGIAHNHSLLLKTNLQYQKLGNMNYLQKQLYPRGNDFNISPEKMIASAIEYKFPLCYPDGGIGNFLIISRISLGAFGEYAHAQVVTDKLYKLNPYTYGGELIFDYHVFGLTPTFRSTISIYSPSQSKGIACGATFNINM